MLSIHWSKGEAALKGSCQLKKNTLALGRHAGISLLCFKD